MAGKNEEMDCTLVVDDCQPNIPVFRYIERGINLIPHAALKSMSPKAWL
jgi:hypothetical protein